MAAATAALSTGARPAERVLVGDPPEADDLLDRVENGSVAACGHDRDAPRDGHPVERRHRLVQQLGRPGGRGERADRDPQQGRLAGAVAADERDALADADVEVDAAQRPRSR